MINYQVTTTQWLSLSPQVKTKLKEIFSIPRSEGTHMMDGRVLSDGHTHRDLERISVAAMQKFTGNKKETDFYKLFEKVLAKVEAGLALKQETVSKGDAVVVAKPSEELFVEHNGKTYKLTEVASATASPVAPVTPLYPPAPSSPFLAAAKPNQTAGKGAANVSGKGTKAKAGGKTK